MIANYHTHTWRCHHAIGTEREYVEAAIQGGLKILGFSDHTPMPYDGGYVSDSKMTMDQLEGYVKTVLALKEEYQDKIEIHLGLEVEYYPKYFQKLVSFVSQYPIEYFLLGQHFLGNEIDDVFSGAATEREDLLARYCSQTMEAMDTGCFTYFAHPDLIRFTGDDRIYERHIRPLCEHAKKLDIPLEINCLGIWNHRHYPSEKFWKIAGEVGNKAVFGSDAHQPGTVWNPPALETARQIAQKYGLSVLETVPLKVPHSFT